MLTVDQPTAMRQMVTVRLYGPLRKCLPEQHRRGMKVCARNVPDAVDLMDASCPGLKAEIMRLDRRYKFHVQVDNQTVGEAKLSHPLAGKVIKIVPVTMAAASTGKGVAELVIGIALIAVAAVVSQGAALAFLAPYAGAIGTLGAGLALSGISALLAAPPVTPKSGSRPGFNYGSPAAITTQGCPYPVLYGRMEISGVLANQGVITKDILSGTYDTSTTTTNATSDTGPGSAAVPLLKNTAPASKSSNDLRDRQYAMQQYFVSHGPIVGPVDGGKSLLLNGTPLLDTRGDVNFKNFEVYFLPGTPQQSYMPIDGGLNTVGINVEVLHGTPWVGVFNDTNLDALRIAIEIPALYRVDSKTGGYDSREVEFQIELKSGTGDYQLVNHTKINKSFQSPYVRDFDIELSQAGPWVVRVTRLTNDTPDPTKIADRTVVDSYTTITHAKMRHPGIANLLVMSDAEETGGSIPTMSTECKGRIVKVPVNYDSAARTYSGAWDGSSFKDAWTDNPAWCIADFMLHPVYGGGKFFHPERMNWAEWYRISQRCDEIVTDPDGVQRRRHTFNCYIGGDGRRDNLLSKLSELASSFCGQVYYANGIAQPVQDRPGTLVSYQFNPTNVENGRFHYETSPLDTRANRVTAKFYDSSNHYKQDQAAREDDSDILTNGLIQEDLDAVACADRFEAERFANYKIYTEQFQYRTATFTTTSIGGFLLPGTLIEIFDPRETLTATYSFVQAVTATGVTLGMPVTLAPGISYVVSLVRSATVDGQETMQQVIRHVTTPAGATSVLTFDIPLEQSDTVHLPPVGSAVNLVDVAAPVPRWWVVSGKQNDAQKHEITAVNYPTADKWELIDKSLPFAPPVPPPLPNAADPVLPPLYAEDPVEYDTVSPTGEITRFIRAHWHAPDMDFVDGYHVWVRYNGGNWTSVTDDVGANQVDVLAAQGGGTYDLRIFTRRLDGKESDDALVLSLTLPGTNLLPGISISGLELTGKAHDLVNEEPDFHFAWRFNSPAMVGQVGGDGAPATAGIQDPNFGYYLVTVLDADTLAEVWTDKRSTPDYTFTRAQNSQAFGGNPHPTIVFAVMAMNKGGLPMSSQVSIQVSNPAPPPCTGLTLTPSVRGLQAGYRNGSAPDLQTDILSLSTTPNFGDAKEYDVGLGGSAAISDLVTGQTYYGWIQAVDTFGNRSVPYPSGEGVSATVDSVGATDLEDFAVTATKRFTNTFDPEGDEWTSNTPAAGSIAWNAHQVVVRGQIYPIPAGSTSKPWVWWHVGDATYSTADANPINTVPGWNNTTYFQVARNLGGNYENAWRGFANAIIGSAYIEDEAVGESHIQDAAITSAKIGDAQITNAKIGDLQVDTLKIGPNAVTIPVSARGADVTANGWVTALTLYVQSTGAPASIDCAWGVTWPSDSTSPTRADVSVVRNDGKVIDTAAYQTVPGSDLKTYFADDDATLVTTPGSPASYALQLRRSNVAGTTTYQTTWAAPKMRYREVRR